MSSIILSTALLAPISYISEMHEKSDVFIEYHENYQRQTYRNRFRILGPNGPQTLSIPVMHTHGQKMPIQDVRIEYRSPWQKQHLRSLFTAYNNSPFFLYYQDEIIPFFEKEYTFLLDLNHDLLLMVLRQLKMKVNLQPTLSFIKTYEEKVDFRYVITPKEAPHRALKPYTQVFGEKYGFIEDLSIIDLLYNEGPEAVNYLGK